jgi:hypothetical protein
MLGGETGKEVLTVLNLYLFQPSSCTFKRISRTGKSFPFQLSRIELLFLLNLTIFYNLTSLAKVDDAPTLSCQIDFMPVPR